VNHGKQTVELWINGCVFAGKLEIQLSWCRKM